MTETPSTYLTHTTGSRPAVIVAEPAPLDTRTRLFVIVLRRALLLVCDGLAELAGPGPGIAAKRE